MAKLTLGWAGCLARTDEGVSSPCPQTSLMVCVPHMETFAPHVAEFKTYSHPAPMFKYYGWTDYESLQPEWNICTYTPPCP